MTHPLSLTREVVERLLKAQPRDPMSIMTQLMPLSRVVVEITHEAKPDDPSGTRKAIRSWHNRLQNGTIPRSLVTRLGRGLFLKVGAWQEFCANRGHQVCPRKHGRPRKN